jgi:hypothetical protein
MHHSLMTTAKTSTSRKRAVKAISFDTRVHASEMRVMRLHMNDVTSSREKSIDFLKRAGLVTAAGKVKQLVRA